MKEEISSINSVIFHLSKESKNWNLSNPYSNSLRCLLTESPQFIKAERTGQIYNFISKIISDELTISKKEIRKNITAISEKIKNFLKHKNSENGKDIVLCLFYILILNLLEKNYHFDSIKENEIKLFLKEFNYEERGILLRKEILCLYYGMEIQGFLEINKSETFELSLGILRDILLIKKEGRSKDKLLSLYQKQKILEDLNFSTNISSSQKEKFLEMGVILKSALNKGLYIPNSG